VTRHRQLHECRNQVYYALETAGIEGDHDGLLEYNSLGTDTHVHTETGAFDRLLESLSSPYPDSECESGGSLDTGSGQSDGHSHGRAIHSFRPVNLLWISDHCR